MPKLDRITTIQYMGSKSRMLDSICMPIIKNTKINTVVDLFAGTGCVGFALSPYKAIIIPKRPGQSFTSTFFISCQRF